MSSSTITLNHTWRLGTRIGKGGFAQVFAAQGEDGADAVVKLVHKEPGADRELLFRSVTGTNIIPVLDSGEWEDNYVLVMPRAEMSLRKHLEDSGGRLPIEEGVEILIDVAEALASVRKQVVHRDLKPENVLRYQGKWCLADFGISRYAEATTSPDTRKYSMTPPYAAPEQWRAEHATWAADIYAFGVMAFEIFEGRWPFSGPDSADFRHQHLTQPPPPMANTPPAIASIVTSCLQKAAAARPTPEVILTRLRNSQVPASPAGAALQEANQQIVAQQAEEGAHESARQTREEQRAELFTAAQGLLQLIEDSLVTQIRSGASAATITQGDHVDVQFGPGRLVIYPVSQASLNALGGRDGNAPFDVIAYTHITVRIPQDRYGWEGRSHSLWYCDAYEEGVYRWYELAFMLSPFSSRTTSVAPFNLAPTDKDAAGSLWTGIHTHQLAWGPAPFDQGEEQQFIDRWIGWLARASTGSFGRPNTMPEGPTMSFRRSRG